jgi:hypothetical protein
MTPRHGRAAGPSPRCGRVGSAAVVAEARRSLDRRPSWREPPRRRGPNIRRSARARTSGHDQRLRDRTCSTTGHPVPDRQRPFDASLTPPREQHRVWDHDTPDEQWVIGFTKAVGSDPDESPQSAPPDFLTAAVPLVPVVRRSRNWWRRSPSSSCLEGTARGSTPTAITWRSGSAPPDGGRGCSARDPIRRHAHQRHAAGTLRTVR